MKSEFQSYVFDDVHNKLVSANCLVTSNVLTVTDENHKICIFPILSVNVWQPLTKTLTEDSKPNRSSHSKFYDMKILHVKKKSDISFFVKL